MITARNLLICPSQIFRLTTNSWNRPTSPIRLFETRFYCNLVGLNLIFNFSVTSSYWRLWTVFNRLALYGWHLKDHRGEKCKKVVIDESISFRMMGFIDKMYKKTELGTIFPWNRSVCGIMSYDCDVWTNCYSTYNLSQNLTIDWTLSQIREKSQDEMIK